jgi:UDP-glucuronate decarboxylase
MIIELTGSKSKKIYKKLPEDDPMQRQPDINMAAKYLDGWYPETELKKGLIKTIEYFEKII